MRKAREVSLRVERREPRVRPVVVDAEQIEPVSPFRREEGHERVVRARGVRPGAGTTGIERERELVAGDRREEFRIDLAHRAIGVEFDDHRWCGRIERARDDAAREPLSEQSRTVVPRHRRHQYGFRPSFCGRAEADQAHQHDHAFQSAPHQMVASLREPRASENAAPARPMRSKRYSRVLSRLQRLGTATFPFHRNSFHNLGSRGDSSTNPCLFRLTDNRPWFAVHMRCLHESIDR